MVLIGENEIQKNVVKIRTVATREEVRANIFLSLSDSDVAALWSFTFLLVLISPVCGVFFICPK